MGIIENLVVKWDVEMLILVWYWWMGNGGRKTGNGDFDGGAEGSKAFKVIVLCRYLGRTPGYSLDRCLCTYQVGI